jgi:hypothetical protein
MKTIKYITILVSLLTITTGRILYSQHEHHNHEHTTDSVKTADTTMQMDTTKIKSDEHQHDHNMDNHDMTGTDHEMSMPHSFSLSLPMNRNGSGTGWLPDNSPMNGYMLHSGKWMFMFHGGVFLRYTASDVTKEGTRGFSKWDAPNWFMGMGQAQIGKNGLFRLSVMMSLDRLTEEGSGYPLLFQSGETWEGKPLVDRQHPHDLFSEVSIAYTQRLSKKIDITGYFGYPGEPALGTVAFMHRVSSSNNPDAPLSHHWQDATHITFGVGTLGIRYGIFKAEGSVFTGREPDENRYNFDKAKFDSYSYRLLVNPNKYFALQFSQGFIKSPEMLESDVNITRTTASVIHSYDLSNGKNINTTFAWGLNNKGHGHNEHSFLLESNFSVRKINLYGRYEFVQKDPEELALTVFSHDKAFNINALTLGTNYRIFSFNNTDISLGAQGSLYFTPTDLQPIYGKNPLSAQIYLKISPGSMNHGKTGTKESHKKHKH